MLAGGRPWGCAGDDQVAPRLPVRLPWLGPPPAGLVVILGLLAVLAVAAAGSVGLTEPASRWTGWIALTALGFLFFIAVLWLMDAFGTAGRARRDAARRNPRPR